MSTLAANSFTMETAVQTALMQNPDLKAARMTVFKAQARLQQAGRWPNPSLTLSGISDMAFRNDGAGAITAGLSQRFPLTSRLADSREVARIAVLEALREIRNQERLLIHRVQSAFIDCLAAQAESRALANLHAAAEKNLTLARDQLSAGRGSLAAQALALATERRLWNRFEAAFTATEFELLGLKSLLGLPPDHKLALHGSLESVIADLQRRSRPARIHRPDLDLALLAVDRSAAEEKLARSSAWEGVTIGVDYLMDRGMDEPEGLGTDQFLGVTLSIPLPLWDNNSGAIAAGAAARRQAQARVAAKQLDISNSIASLVRRSALLRARLADYPSKILSPVEQTATELQKAFNEGRTELRDLLAVQQELADLRLATITLATELAAALATLEAESGSHPTVGLPYITTSPKADPIK